MSPEVIDLAGFDVKPKSDQGVPMDLLDPTGRHKTGVVFIVRGMESEAYTDMQQEHVRRAIARAPRKATEQERDAEFYELSATLVADWQDGAGKSLAIKFTKEDEPKACTPENVMAVLRRHQWVFEQVLRFAGARGNFLPGSARS